MTRHQLNVTARPSSQSTCCPSGVLRHTAKPFDLAALKVGDFVCKNRLAPFILTNENYTNPNILVNSSYFGLHLIFAQFNFVVSFGLQNSTIKGHASIKGL